MKHSIVCCVLLAALGCAAPANEFQPSGFLSDYGALDTLVDDGRVFVNEAGLAERTRFLLDPIVVLAPEEGASRSTVVEVKAYMEAELIEAIEASAGRNAIATMSGPGIARIRIALTEVENTRLGPGGASMEAEIVDSVSGEQLAAAVLSQRGRSLFSVVDPIGTSAAKVVVDDWVERFTSRVLQGR